MLGFVVVLILAAIIWAVFRKKDSPKLPAPTTFRCVDCAGLFEHYDRTLAILNKNQYAKLYCKKCFRNHPEYHKKDSLKSTPSKSSTPSSKSGCLGFIALFTVMPLALIAFQIWEKSI